ncbi:hypothetical protein RCL1_001928 [Eukaryota sp. TZLM3-RCL]
MDDLLALSAMFPEYVTYSKDSSHTLLMNTPCLHSVLLFSQDMTLKSLSVSSRSTEKPVFSITDYDCAFDLITELVNWKPSLKSAVLKATLLKFHHICDPKKIKKFTNWAKQHNISGGFLHFNSLYIIVAVGSEDDMDIFVRLLRSLPWQSMKVVSEKLLEENKQHQFISEAHFNTITEFKIVLEGFWGESINLSQIS